MSNKALTSDRHMQGHSGGSHTGWPYNTERPSGQMTGTTESNGLMTTIKIIHHEAEMSAVRTKAVQRLKQMTRRLKSRISLFLLFSSGDRTREPALRLRLYINDAKLTVCLVVWCSY